MNRALLTFDLGTTRLKVAAFDLDGRLIGQVARRHRDLREAALEWQSADQWWRDATDATRQLLREFAIDPSAISGISLSGRAGAAVFVDAEGRVIADPWTDSRHNDALKALVHGLDRRDYALYGATLLSKFTWLRENQPAVAARVRHVMYAKDFLLFRMTGEVVTDPASGPDGPWDARLLTRSQVDIDQLPRPAMPWSLAGELQAAAAGELGLPTAIPVAVGAHDGICANTGAGAAFPGQYALTLGTHAVIRGISDKWPQGALRFYGYPPDLHVLGGNALMAGRALDWFVDNWFGTEENERQAIFASLDEIAGQIEPGADGVRFLPFLNGQLAPERRPGARASFHGLHVSTNRGAMYRAVLEGASFALADIFVRVQGWAGAPTHIGVTGSGANSETWIRMLADLLGQPLALTDGASEGRGAAIFCAIALGEYPDLARAIDAMVNITRTVEPDPGAAAAYAGARDEWHALIDASRVFDKPNRFG